jgi:hypothetical protein
LIAGLIQSKAERDIAEALLADAARVRLLAIGEVHPESAVLQELIIPLLPKLKAIGFSKLAIELPTVLEKSLKEFEKDGDEHNLATVISNCRVTVDYLPLLRAARANRIDIVPVCIMPIGSPPRESILIENVCKIARANRVIFWGGGSHTHRRPVIATKFKSMAEGVSEHLGRENIYCVTQIIKCDKFQNLEQVFAELPSPFYVRTQAVPEIAHMTAFPKTCGPEGENKPSHTNRETFNIEYGHWDALILFPLQNKRE